MPNWSALKYWRYFICFPTNVETDLFSSPGWATQSSGARGRSGRSCSTPLFTCSSTLHVVLLLPRSTHVLAWTQKPSSPSLWPYGWAPWPRLCLCIWALFILQIAAYWEKSLACDIYYSVPRYWWGVRRLITNQHGWHKPTLEPGSWPSLISPCRCSKCCCGGPCQRHRTKLGRMQWEWCTSPPLRLG